ncbi:hypothetical protein G6F70_000763 [Rhizopus microsporus]|nr:hypothetical protein G6F71_000536 [Rhizopus microsporus]KAG1204107.1 hypothetical protein G6F70_000763 [Rhizopus microsporus]KAG1215474.1 hypothetical protein G6F69_000992 [Rhizopus microsporus]KAG1238022.1 hypothetical protein G6F67_000762 [Rhizopus microsporus]KAG1269305.1 hypothetical protein G6F68_000382 [Rhizopus microsporus]
MNIQKPKINIILVGVSRIGISTLTQAFSARTVKTFTFGPYHRLAKIVELVTDKGIYHIMDPHRLYDAADENITKQNAGDIINQLNLLASPYIICFVVTLNVESVHSIDLEMMRTIKRYFHTSNAKYALVFNLLSTNLYFKVAEDNSFRKTLLTAYHQGAGVKVPDNDILLITNRFVGYSMPEQSELLTEYVKKIEAKHIKEQEQRLKELLMKQKQQTHPHPSHSSQQKRASTMPAFNPRPQSMSPPLPRRPNSFQHPTHAYTNPSAQNPYINPRSQSYNNTQPQVHNARPQAYSNSRPQAYNNPQQQQQQPQPHSFNRPQQTSFSMPSFINPHSQQQQVLQYIQQIQQQQQQRIQQIIQQQLESTTPNSDTSSAFSFSSNDNSSSSSFGTDFSMDPSNFMDTTQQSFNTDPSFNFDPTQQSFNMDPSFNFDTSQFGFDSSSNLLNNLSQFNGDPLNTMAGSFMDPATAVNLMASVFSGTDTLSATTGCTIM